MTSVRNHPTAASQPSFDDAFMEALGKSLRGDGGAAAKQASRHPDVPKSGQNVAISPEKDWGSLIDRIKNAAQAARDNNERLELRERKVETVLTEARDKLRDAAERTQAAEERALDAETKRQEAVALAEQVKQQAREMIASADERARFAEEQAEIALTWLDRVQQVILTEFANMPDMKGSDRGADGASLRLVG